MTNDLYNYLNYKEYLAFRLTVSGPNRGARSMLATTLKVKSAYISQVINGDTHLSLEQAIVVNEFLGHSTEEGEFFVLLVQMAKSGTKKLELFFKKQINAVLEKRNSITGRIHSSTEIDAKSESVYYGRWYYSAIHVMTMIPEFQKIETLARYLNMAESFVRDILDFLIELKLVSRDGELFVCTKKRIHLPPSSSNIYLHQSNWRLKAIESISIRKEEDLHYSGPIAISREDAMRIRSHVLQNISETEKIINDSNEEEIYAICIDFFRL